MLFKAEKKNKKKIKIHSDFLIFYLVKKYYPNLVPKLLPARWEKIIRLLNPCLVYVHRGSGYSKFKINDYHAGFKFGLFSHTRKPFIFRPKKKKNKRNLRR